MSKKKKTLKKITREAWLELAIKKLRPIFKSRCQITLPKKIRVTLSFPLGRKPTKVLGQSLSRDMSAGKFAELLINPTIASPLRVLDVLAHELIHTWDGNKHGHRGPFPRVAKALGLKSPWRATTASPELVKVFKQVLKTMPKYPHKEITPTAPHKKQTTRMVKLECGFCGFICRASRAAVQMSGPPICGCGDERIMDVPDIGLFNGGGK